MMIILMNPTESPGFTRNHQGSPGIPRNPKESLINLQEPLESQEFLRFLPLYFWKARTNYSKCRAPRILWHRLKYYIIIVRSYAAVLRFSPIFRTGFCGFNNSVRFAFSCQNMVRIFSFWLYIAQYARGESKLHHGHRQCPMDVIFDTPLSHR